MQVIEFIRGLEVSQALSPGDRMYRSGRNYFGVGRSALLAIMTALSARLGYAGGDQPVASILDYGCGHGRVARYLRAAFPNATVHVSDLDRAGVQWCVNEFGCVDMGPTLAPQAYDVIWLGSVFTHLREAAALELLTMLKTGVRPNGVLIFTSQGRYAAMMAERRLQQEMTSAVPGTYHLDSASLARMVKDFHQTGYGFASYAKQPGYGASIVKQSWYQDHVVDTDFLQIAAQEKGWDNHQDVQAFIRAPLPDPRKGAFFDLVPSHAPAAIISPARPTTEAPVSPAIGT
jgi:SAM-dependent methyltransferase